MTTRFRVWLDGQGLHDLDDALIITDVQELPPVTSTEAVHPAGRDGTRLLHRRRRSLSVRIRYMIREYNPTHRQEVMEKVRRWACGTTLTLSDRPHQQLTVLADEVPVISSALKWTDEMTLTLTAYALPYWQSAHPAVLTTASSASLYIPGDAPAAPVDATVTLTQNLSSGSVTLSAGATAITLAGLTLPAGSIISFTHDAAGMPVIRAGSRSLLEYRTPDSADDLLALPGNRNTFGCKGGTAVFSVRGVWL